MQNEPLEDRRQRIDKWLFFARFVKSRALAQALIEAGLVSVNGQAIHQPSRLLKIGDRVELALESGEKIVIVAALAERRGPFAEASQLYRDQSVPGPRLTPFERAQRAVRPSK